MKPILTILLAVAALAAAFSAQTAFAATPYWTCDPSEGRVRQVRCTFFYDEDSAPSVNRGRIDGFVHPPYCATPLPEEPAAGYLRPAPGLVVVSADGLTYTYTANDDTPSVPLVALTTLVTGSGRSLPVPSACFTVDAVNGRAPGSTEVVTPREGSNLWRVPHFFAVEYRNTHSFVRIVNLSATDSIFTVKAYDETGDGRFTPLRIRVAAESAAAFNSRDLEFNEEEPPKFLDGEFVANGRGNWRLDITPSTSTPIDNTQYYVGAYARTEGDFLTNMGEYARAIPNGDDLVRPNLYVLPSFNPAGNRTKVSNLRLSNLTDSATGNFALVAISDRKLFRAARLPEMAAGATRMWTAEEVEEMLGGGSISGKQTFIIGGPEALVTHLMHSKDAGDGTAGLWTNLTAVTNSAGAIGAEEARRLWAKGLATGLRIRGG